ncbi:hypothetical protein [Paractinoplanes deccanensis]|uniref:hypothetical protein n=1 Tax=Paractinoplanes deccanensis TaxID=113561 RepID=UPI0019420D8B|nr:hypothetical protein [Actinoplanes deccanensis]
MKAPAWSALAAWVALGISIANLWYSVVRAWLRERKASPGAQLDLFTFQTKTGWHDDVRVVVTNHGPALMRKVEVQVFDEDGQSLELAEADVAALWPKMPVEYLHKDQSLYLTLNRSPETRDARGALIRWNDGRRRQQSVWVNLSYHRVP